MSLTDLVQALERDAATQVRATLEAAHAHTEALVAEATRAREQLAARDATAWTDASRARCDERVAAAHQRARATLLTARAAMLERVRVALHARLPALTTHAGDALARAAFRFAGARTGVVRCAPAIAAHLRVIAPATLRVEETDAAATGLVIELDGGPRIVATLAALVDRDWPRLAPAIVAAADEEVRP